MKRFMHWLDRFDHAAILILLAGLVAVVSLQVLSRFVLKIPIEWSEEIARFIIGPETNPSRIFYYAIASALYLEIIDKRNRDLKHVVRLVDVDGAPIALPPGARFEHVRSDECLNLLDHHLRSEEQQSRLAHA